MANDGKLRILLDSNMLFKKGQLQILGMLPRKTGAKVVLCISDITLTEFRNNIRKVVLEDLGNDARVMSEQNIQRMINQRISEANKAIHQFGVQILKTDETQKLSHDIRDKADRFLVQCATQYGIRHIVSADRKAVNPEDLKRHYGISYGNADNFLTKFSKIFVNESAMIFSDYNPRYSTGTMHLRRNWPKGLSGFRENLEDIFDHFANGEVFVRESHEKGFPVTGHWRKRRGEGH